MNLKLSILLLLTFLLLSCQAEEGKSLEPKNFEINEVNKIMENETDDDLDLIYITDPMMPYYVMLDEDYVIGNQRVEKGDTLALPFQEAQIINNIKIVSQAYYELELLVEEKVHKIIVEEGDNVYNIFSVGLIDHIDVTLLTGSVDSFPIDTILIEGYHQLTLEAYENYKVQKKWMSDLQLAIDWQDDPMENLKLIPELKGIYSNEQLLMYGQSVDFQRLENSADICIGYPILVTGPVESYEHFQNYSMVTVKSGLSDKSIVIYFDEFQNDIDFVNVIAIFLGHDEELKFHSSSILK